MWHVWGGALVKPIWHICKSGDSICNQPFEENVFVNGKYHKNHSNISLSHKGYRHFLWVNHFYHSHAQIVGTIKMEIFASFFDSCIRWLDKPDRWHSVGVKKTDKNQRKQ